MFSSGWKYWLLKRIWNAAQFCYFSSEHYFSWGLKIWRRWRQRERRRPLRNRFNNKPTTLHMHHAFWYISLLTPHDYDVKMGQISRFMEDVGEFAYICQSRWVGLIEIKIERLLRRVEHSLLAGCILAHPHWSGLCPGKAENKQNAFNQCMCFTWGVIYSI